MEQNRDHIAFQWAVFLQDTRFPFIPALLHTNLMHTGSLLAWVVLIGCGLWLASLSVTRHS